MKVTRVPISESIHPLVNFLGVWETWDVPSQRCKSKLVAEEESMSYFNLAMGKDFESQPVPD